jgi:phenylacetate-coenzyme A ligase PaaK-like adenylate-forming protein
MTEMGLGGGVECQALDGYHLREADLYFEIVDPLTGLPVDEGKPGEVVFSTLTRRGMPLLRYRTGDVSRFIPHPCCCGTVLKRMERIAGRVQGGVLLDNHYLTMTDFDEVLFTMDFVLDFKVILTGAGGENCLQVHLKTKEGSQSMMRIKVEKLLNTIPVVKQSRSRGHLALEIYFADYGWTVSNGMSKRMIIDLRGGA